MAAQYDNFASDYVNWSSAPGSSDKNLPVRAFRRAIGSHAKGARCLDLACGFGKFGRILAELGAAYVVGVDISEKMLDIAREQASPVEGVEIDYFQADLEQPLELPSELRAKLAPGPGGTKSEEAEQQKQRPLFDIITAVFCLNYASNPSALTTMYRTIATHLSPTGRFVGITENFNPRCAGFQLKYGMTTTIIDTVPLPSGDEGYKVHHAVPSAGFGFDNFALGEQVYKECARDAGLVDVKFELLGWDILTEEERAKPEEQEFWKEYFAEGQAHIQVVTARRGAGSVE